MVALLVLGGDLKGDAAAPAWRLAGVGGRVSHQRRLAARLPLQLRHF